MLFENIFYILQEKKRMNCPKYNSGKKIKTGFTKGKQRHKCKDCGYTYTVELKSTVKPDSMKKQVLRLYFEESGFRSIRKTVRSKQRFCLKLDQKIWKKYQNLIWKAKRQNNDSLILSSETEAIKRQKSFGTK
ncbi:Transposase [Bacteroidales bacterium Barb7]|nr:Transposase [Bacteroidales bacterium Barb7]